MTTLMFMGRTDMTGLKVSNGTSEFEVPTVLDDTGKLTEACARTTLGIMERHGFVILTNLLSDEQADVGATLIRQTIDDPDRTRCAFASETDNRYKRRDFCSLPSTPRVTAFAASLCQRLEAVLSEYCDRSRPLLEVTTLTSYAGSSHQYIHRDPRGVLSLFAAVEDVTEEQGGTVFVCGTQLRGDADDGADDPTEQFRLWWNGRILVHNLKKLWRMRRGYGPPLAPGEFADRVFSRTWDEHQPNLLRFASGKNSQFSLRMFTPGRLWSLYRARGTVDDRFRLVATAPRKGTVIVYLSDMLHAGPDNRSPHPRRLFSMSIAREEIDAKRWHAGYSPHPTLAANPLSLGDLLAMSPPASSSVEPRRVSALAG